MKKWKMRKNAGQFPFRLRTKFCLVSITYMLS